MSDHDLAELEERVRASEFQGWAGIGLMGMTRGTATFDFTPFPTTGTWSEGSTAASSGFSPTRPPASRCTPRSGRSGPT